MANRKIKMTESQIVFAISSAESEQYQRAYEIEQDCVYRNKNYDDCEITLIDIGKIFAIAECCPERGQNSLIISTVQDDIDEGFAGNSDRTIRRHYGWRGTTNNVAIYAAGIAKLESIKIHPKTYRTVLTFTRLPCEE